MSIRKTTIFSTIIIFLFNAVLVLTYYRFYLVNRYEIELQKLSNNYSEKLDIIIPSLEKTNNLNETLEKIVETENAVIIVKDKDNKLVYSSSEKTNIYAATSIFNNNNETYLISYSDYKNAQIPNYLIIQNFMIFQIGLGVLFIILGIIFANSKLLAPVAKLQHDVEKYKEGIKPSKRKIKTSIDEVQNTFVELVDNLDEEKNRQNRIIASISHDIKTPLTSIMGYADRLNNAKLSDETKKTYIEKIYNKSIVMKELIEEFDDYLSCNITETLKLNEITINDLIKILKNDYEDELLEKGIAFNIESNCLKSKINIDLFKIKRVFSNIITNSINHTNTKKIDIDISKKRDNIIFKISDNGSGVNPEYIDKIFEPLFTTDPSRKISGLGLSICKKIIEVHDGVIQAYNKDGLTIEFKLKEKRD